MARSSSRNPSSKRILSPYTLEENLLNATVYGITGLTSKILKAKYKPSSKNIVESVTPDLEEQCQSGNFARLPPSDRPVILCTTDARQLSSKSSTSNNGQSCKVSLWYCFSKYGVTDPYKIIDTARRLENMLCQWICHEAARLLNIGMPLKHEALTKCALPSGLKRRAGIWSGFAWNKGTSSTLIQCVPHRDFKSLWKGVSCLCPFGQYEGRGMILWEARTVVELQPGDLLFFPNHWFVHSKEAVRGIRDSMVGGSGEDRPANENRASRRR
jgi:hypothetical protein